jgi:hypothetical protein
MYSNCHDIAASRETLETQFLGFWPPQVEFLAPREL